LSQIPSAIPLNGIGTKIELGGGEKENPEHKKRQALNTHTFTFRNGAHKFLFLTLIRSQKLSDKTDSDATSGIGVEMHPASTSSESERPSAPVFRLSDNQRRLSRFNISNESSMNPLRRASSIYDNLSSVGDDLTIPEEGEVSDNYILETMNNITRMIDEITFEFAKEDTLRKNKSKNASKIEENSLEYLNNNYNAEPKSNTSNTLTSTLGTLDTSEDTTNSEDLIPLVLPSDGENYF
jgi:hypothetical protein